MHSLSSSVTSRSVAPSPQFVHDETAIARFDEPVSTMTGYSLYVLKSVANATSTT